MKFTTFVTVVVASIAAPIHGFAPASLSKVPAHVSKIKIDNKSIDNRKPSQISHSSNSVLQSTATVSIDMSDIETQRSLNGVQSNIVRALMVSFIASMCIALPV